MVGNTYPYTVHEWKDDIALASSRGIDAFALNVGPEDWQYDSVVRCYAAALELKTPFKLFMSFDMTRIPGNTREDVRLLRRYMAGVAHHPNQLLYHGKVLVSTFAGQDSLFGHATVQEAWQFVKDSLEDIAPIHLIPSFFIDPRRYPHITAMDGYFNWNGSWPIHLTVDSPRHEIECPKLDTDRHHIHHLGGRTFMAAVSPWFFTHYGPDSWNKNARLPWIYRGDDWLFVRRWTQLIAMRDQVDIVQIISWNDYGESHYIGPIKGAQPNSEAWVDGFPHDAWLDLNEYFARAFKDGAYPPIERDRIFMWSRPHLKAANATHDTVPRPDRWELTDDKFWVVIFAIAPAEVRVSGTDGGLDGRSWLVKKGVTTLSHPMTAGGGMKATMFRDGVVVADCAPSHREFRVHERPRTYNFNVFVAASLI
ncbi:glycoside hydrolase family 71 protein [Lentinus tigrinus ALCF2SS1-7]|uniref:glycoside hydrolase family 71 protein n=1 Tax=Lentinus tigrinus ALCF2SS1-7 TaxID=1328758 RepID=UPI0011660E14|nr:glycoside hydrolase family 71 protein [Lentinus tigrinus ALCF2SS1-7]